VEGESVSGEVGGKGRESRSAGGVGQGGVNKHVRRRRGLRAQAKGKRR
jgi:hypothetical protein